MSRRTSTEGMVSKFMFMLSFAITRSGVACAAKYSRGFRDIIGARKKLL
ncbi:MAG: hypothetical protein ACOX6X_00955 [Dethiobacteria bacterium]